MNPYQPLMNHFLSCSQGQHLSLTNSVFCNANTNGLELQRGKKISSEAVQDI